VCAGSCQHAPDSTLKGTNVPGGVGLEDRAGGDGRTGLTREISGRIEILRILLICGIVVLHTPPTWSLEALPSEARVWPGTVKLFFDYGPFRAGVPTLSLVSGYLLFLSPYGSYWGLVRRKLVTLIVPFLLWNGIVAGLHGLRGQDDLVGLDLTSGDALTAWSAFLDSPPDYPTYFLVDLFICTLLAPLIEVLARRVPVLLLAAGCLAAAYGYGPLPTVRPDVVLPFVAGAVVAVQGIELRALDRCWWQIGLDFLALCTASVTDVAAGRPSPLSLGLLRAAGVPAAWTASAVLARAEVGRWLAGGGRVAFLLFCAHSPALHLLADAWPRNASYWLFYATAAPAVIAASIVTGLTLEGRGGPAWTLLTGSRRGAASRPSLLRTVRPALSASKPG
jgi:succinoglycan biosynthesis protein ExoH